MRLLSLLAIGVLLGCAASEPRRPSQPVGGHEPEQDAGRETDASLRPDLRAPVTPASMDAAVPADTAAAVDTASPADTAPLADTKDAATDARAPTATDQITYPENIARTMALLANSTPEKRNAVRILVFGQSISDSNARWWPMVRDRLKAQYPYADLTMETRGEGGCAARCLLGEAEDRHGLKIDFVTTRAIPYKADLVIFHVYGNETSYEQIITMLRGSGAEVLLQSDHQTWRPADGSPYPQGTREASSAAYQTNVQRNTVWMVDMAKRRGAAVAPVWREWGKYLDANNLKGRDLTGDGLHPNDRGHTVIAGAIERAMQAARPR